MWGFEVILIGLFALGVFYGITLDRFEKRMRHHEGFSISRRSAAAAATLFALKEYHDDRKYLWRYGRAFYAVSFAFQLLIIVGAAWFLVTFLLKWQA